ncbi:hypothetical protein R3O55_012990 [Bacteroides hominis]|uniref:hypothetical protein n=1 Tax=Bacteroides hominis TaxID=2763023 RepID=UPI00294A5FDE|nr:hypothetical protein [Bacteroides hominis (ex Liu et al. 2022)]MDV6135644.1 hypothetical protein [Bacteroides hominis (ex Liu et al. 2022)]MDV6152692.1 hypothetical protein [Bacteroides hominis (ex Liu et al. 2022)]
MLIDISFFTSGPRHIENASMAKMPTQNSLAVNEAINGYIEAFQYDFLLHAVGNNLADAITDYIEVVGQEKDGTIDSEKLDEAESGYAVLCSKIRESFADYVFFHILRDMNSQATVTGLVRLKCANEYVSPIGRQVSTWNAMVGKNRLFAAWISSNDCPFDVKIDKNLLTTINTFNL